MYFPVPNHFPGKIIKLLVNILLQNVFHNKNKFSHHWLVFKYVFLKQFFDSLSFYLLNSSCPKFSLQNFLDYYLFKVLNCFFIFYSRLTSFFFSRTYFGHFAYLIFLSFIIFTPSMISSLLFCSCYTFFVFYLFLFFPFIVIFLFFTFSFSLFFFSIPFFFLLFLLVLVAIYSHVSHSPYKFSCFSCFLFS